MTSVAGCPRRGRRWHVGVVLVLAALPVAGVPAHADDAAPEVAGAGARQFDIAPQPLAAALIAFSEVTGLELVFDAGMVRDRRSPGLHGRHDLADGLARLLAGTGFAPRFLNARTVTLDRLPEAADQTRLQPLVVDGSRRFVSDAERPWLTPGSSAHISREQLDRVPPSSTGDIFKTTPGVISSMNRNGSALDVNIRGLQGMNRVKVAVDGTQQSTSTWRGYQGVDERVYVDPDLIGGIDITKGPSGGAAGAGVTGGVVAIRTLNPDDILAPGQDVGLRLRGSTSNNSVAPPSPMTLDQRADRPGFFDLDNGSASLVAATRQERFDLIGAIAHRRSGNYFAGTKGDPDYSLTSSNGSVGSYPLSYTEPGEEVFNTSQDTVSGLVKARLRLTDDHSLDLGWSHYGSTFGEVSPTVLLFPYSLRQVGMSKTRVNTYTAGYRWFPLDDELFDLRVNLWATTVNASTRYAAPGLVLPEWGIYPNESARRTDSQTYGADITNVSAIDTGYGRVSLSYGGSYSVEFADGESYSSESASKIEYPLHGRREVGSLFSSGTWQAADWLTIGGGLRYDGYRTHDARDPSLTPTGNWPISRYPDKNGGRLNPSVNVTVTPWQGVQLFALYAEGMRPPSLRESAFSESLLYPNPDLEPEVTRNWEVGVNLSNDDVVFDGDAARLKLAYFNNTTENYISRTRTPPELSHLAYYMSRNIDEARFAGIELSGAYDAGVAFVEGALTWYDTVEFCEPGQPCRPETLAMDYGQSHVPPDWSGSLTIGGRFFDQALTLGSRLTYAGERAVPLAGNYNQMTATWNPYTVIDLFGSLEVIDGLTLEMSAENLFDRYYVDALNNSMMPSPGRTIRAGFTARF